MSEANAVLVGQQVYWDRPLESYLKTPGSTYVTLERILLRCQLLEILCNAHKETAVESLPDRLPTVSDSAHASAQLLIKPLADLGAGIQMLWSVLGHLPDGSEFGAWMFYLEGFFRQKDAEAYISTAYLVERLCALAVCHRPPAKKKKDRL